MSRLEEIRQRLSVVPGGNGAEQNAAQNTNRVLGQVSQAKSSEDSSTEGPDERWLISYADMMTLLFGFFVLLYTQSSQLPQVKSAIQSAFTGGVPTVNLDAPVKPVVPDSKVESVVLENPSADSAAVNPDLRDSELKGLKLRLEQELQVQTDLRAEIAKLSTVASQSRSDRIVFKVPCRLCLGWTEFNSSEVARLYGASVSSGVMVTEVTPQGPAERAGFQVGDIVRTVNLIPVASLAGVDQLIRSAAPGAGIQFEVLRGSQSVRLQARLDSLSEQEVQRLQEERTGQSGDSASEVVLRNGLRVRSLSTRHRVMAYVPSHISGVVIAAIPASLDSVLTQQGVAPGSVIQSVNGQTVRSTKDLEMIVSQTRGASTLALVWSVTSRSSFFVELP